ncbi:unnamed protein product [Cochlearia groenlandica]
MKMNINKACDLKSISVFPPNLRRRSSVEPQASQQQQQHQQHQQMFRSQQSQQSFSQGPSSRGSISQSSLEELLLNDQRFSSQERDLSLKKNSFLPPINNISNKRDDSQQMVSARPSSSLTRRWRSVSLGDSKSQTSEEVVQRFGIMETSLSKFGMMLDSIQSDIMQANRGTKEVLLETERIQQKLILQDISLQQLLKEQADVKASIDGAVKSILDELSKDPNQENIQKIVMMLTAIPGQVDTALQKIQTEISHMFTRESQVLRESYSEKFQVFCLSQQIIITLIHIDFGQFLTFQNKTLGRDVKTYVSPKTQVGSWKTVKPEQQRAFKKKAVREQAKPEGTCKQFEQRSIIIDSDEDIDGGFSCLLDGNTKGANFDWDAKKETERLLKTARRTKRKFGNPIIIN